MMTINGQRGSRRCGSAHGLTLVELLVTIMIIGILSSSVLFAMSAAQESARKSRTKAIIASLHSLLMERWESYLTRKYNLTYVDQYSATGPRTAGEFRLKSARQFLKMDFPDQWVDVENISAGNANFPVNDVTYLQLAYENIRITTVTAVLPTDNASTTADDRRARLKTNEGAECLFMIINYIRSDNVNWRKVNEDFIGDTDGDSASEYLDGWGRPISFIRWPAGFSSDVQNGQPATVTDTYDAARLDHDPFDPLWSDFYAYRLVPLIISAGPDGMFDVGIVSLDYTNTTDKTNCWNPYYISRATPGRRAGETYDQNDNDIEDWHDNIHNHLIGTR